MPGYADLTERECRILRLLAQGHAVKTAAVEEGISENAAHELLRSARRKLGVSSSREAARLLAQSGTAPPKIRDKNSGIVAAATDPQSPTAFISTRRLAMLGVMAIGAGAVALIMFSTTERQGGGTPAGAAAASGPRVVGTSPAHGAVIEPGAFVLSVTFDRPMAPQSYSFVQTDEAPHPECSGSPQLSQEGRTYSMECTAYPGATHVVWFNHGPYMAFRSAAGGRVAEPYRLGFSVAGS